MIKDHNTPYWAKMLTAWRDLGKTGLSLPFMLGATTLSNKEYFPSVEDARFLLAEIFEEGVTGSVIRISWCSDTKAYVIGIIEEDTHDGIYLATASSIYAVDLVCQEFGSSPDEIINGLANLYADEIAGRTYSVKNGNWNGYNDAEKAFITSVLKQ